MCVCARACVCACACVCYKFSTTILPDVGQGLGTKKGEKRGLPSAILHLPLYSLPVSFHSPLSTPLASVCARVHDCMCVCMCVYSISPRQSVTTSLCVQGAVSDLPDTLSRVGESVGGAVAHVAEGVGRAVQELPQSIAGGWVGPHGLLASPNVHSGVGPTCSLQWVSLASAWGLRAAAVLSHT